MVDCESAAHPHTEAYGNCSAMWAETVLTAEQLSLVLADTQYVNKLRISALSEAELKLVDAELELHDT